MAVTETWKLYSTEAVMKGIPVPFSTVYVGLGVSGFGVGVDDAPSGELSVSGYARQPVSWADFVTDMTNDAEILFVVGGSWPAVAACFIADAAQGGKVIAYSTFTAVTLQQNDAIRIPVGSLVLT